MLREDVNETLLLITINHLGRPSSELVTFQKWQKIRLCPRVDANISALVFFLDWEKEAEILYLFVLQSKLSLCRKSFDKWDFHLWEVTLVLIFVHPGPMAS